MNDHEMAARLAELGMMPDQARAYVHLALEGPAPAAKLAGALHVSRTRAYRILEDLAAQGHVAGGVGRPKVYTPSDPAVVFATLRAQAERKVQQVTDAQAELVQAFEERRTRQQRSGRSALPHFAVLRGLEAIAAHAEMLQAQAQRSVDVVLAAAGHRALAGAVAPTARLAALAARGVSVRILLAQPGAPGPEGAALAAQLPVRWIQAAQAPTTVMADGRDSLVVVAAGEDTRNGSQGLGFRTDAPACVAGQALLFEHLWSAASRLGRAKPSLPA